GSSSPLERLHGPRHGRRLHREGPQPLQPGAAGRAPRARHLLGRPAAGRSGQRQEPGRGPARDRRRRGRRRGTAREPDRHPAAGRRTVRGRGRSRNPGPAGRSHSHADERARAGSRPAKRPRWRSGGAVLSLPGADPLPIEAALAAAPAKDAPAQRPRYLRQYELIEKVKSYDPTADEALLNRAYVYAIRMLGSQKLASGDPY